MPASDEAFPKGSPGYGSTFSPDDPNGPNYDPVRAEEYRKRLAQKMGSHIGELSEQVDGLQDGQPGFYVPGSTYESKGSPIDNQETDE